MILSYEKIKELTIGAVWMQKEDDGIHFHKCTRKQIDAWYRLSDALGERAERTTGIALDFHTNAKSVKFSVSEGKYEILTDGVLSRQIFGESEIRVTCPEGDHRITLVFPSHGLGVLKSVEIEEGAYVKPHVYDCKMLFLGDSITQGWNTEFDSLSYAYQVSAYYNANRVINGIGGAVYHESTFDIPTFDPDIVVVAYGTNDFLHYQDKEEFQKQVRGYLDKVQTAYHGKKVFVITPIWRYDFHTGPIGSFEEVRKVIRIMAEERQFIVIDGFRLVPHLSQFYCEDALHPNTLGFSAYANQLIREMIRY